MPARHTPASGHAHTCCSARNRLQYTSSPSLRQARCSSSVTLIPAALVAICWGSPGGCIPAGRLLGAAEPAGHPASREVSYVAVASKWQHAMHLDLSIGRVRQAAQHHARKQPHAQLPESTWPAAPRCCTNAVVLQVAREQFVAWWRIHVHLQPHLARAVLWPGGSARLRLRTSCVG